LFSFGLHGPNILGAIMNPIWLSLTAGNADAYAAGTELPNIVNAQFYANFIKLGGAGSTIGLALLCLFVAKSTQFKTLGKLAFGPAIFNINEPLIFGMPIVLNPILMIPFILTPVILAILTYFVMSIGLVPLTNGGKHSLDNSSAIFWFLDQRLERCCMANRRNSHQCCNLLSILQNRRQQSIQC